MFYLLNNVQICYKIDIKIWFKMEFEFMFGVEWNDEFVYVFQIGLGDVGIYYGGFGQYQKVGFVFEQNEEQDDCYNLQWQS